MAGDGAGDKDTQAIQSFPFQMEDPKASGLGKNLDTFVVQFVEQISGEGGCALEGCVLGTHCCL